MDKTELNVMSVPWQSVIIHGVSVFAVFWDFCNLISVGSRITLKSSNSTFQISLLKCTGVKPRNERLSICSGMVLNFLSVSVQSFLHSLSRMTASESRSREKFLKWSIFRIPKNFYSRIIVLNIYTKFARQMPCLQRGIEFTSLSSSSKITGWIFRS